MVGHALSIETRGRVHRPRFRHGASRGATQRVVGGVLLLGALFSLPAQAIEISGSGSSSPYPIYAKWAEAYKATSGIGMNYQLLHSYSGVVPINPNPIDFGATDVPLKPEDLEKSGLTQWPMIIGGVVLAVNLPEVKPGELVLDGPTIADIYLGKFTQWASWADKIKDAGGRAIWPAH